MNEYADVTGIVEATSFETLCLWEKWHQQKGYTWTESTRGPLITIGQIDSRPICIAPLIHVVNGRKIMFLETTSQVVDWAMIEDWLTKNVPSACTTNGKYLNIVSAQNFHTLVH